MLERTPGYWKYGVSSKDGLLCWVILDSNGKEMPPSRPLGDIRLIANAPEMYEMLWNCLLYFCGEVSFSNHDKPVFTIFKEKIMDLIARIGVETQQKDISIVAPKLVAEVEKLTEEKEERR